MPLSMKEISAKEAIVVFEDFSKSIFSSINFSANDTQFKFTPSATSINFLKVYYIVALTVPHIVYFTGSFTEKAMWNNFLYIVFIIAGIFTSFMFAAFLPINEILIDKLLKQVTLIPRDSIGRYLQNKKQFKIEDILEINHIEIKTKSKTEIYLTLVTKKRITQRLFAMSNWENVTQLKAAFSALVFNKNIHYDDSDELSVKFAKTIESSQGKS